MLRRTRSRWFATILVVTTALAVTTAMIGTVATTAATAGAAPPAQQLRVDFAQRTGEVRHGGDGWLYGLNDEGVPSDNLLAPLKVRSIAQAAPFALQHPGGNALDVADQFLRNGGEYIQIYMQEVYAKWPYDSIGDDNGMADYIPKMERTVRAALENPHKDKFVYVPFNEPDWIWYGLGPWRNATSYQQNRDRFFTDWKTAYTRIKALQPEARIAGPNESVYDPRFLADFLPWAKANNVLPDLITWHELPTTELEHYRSHYTDFRELEKKVGIGPLPININEWGGRRDLSVPGRLLQFISMFEDTKVDAGGQAYWNPSGNLSGSASQTNKPTGGWWLSKMYADMTGETVKLTPPQYNKVDTIQGLASIDDKTRQAHVVVGGGDQDTDVVLKNIDKHIFGKSVHVTVSRTTWSGYDADAPPPAVLQEFEVAVKDGELTLPLRGLDELAAYEIVLSPGGGSTPAVNLPWTQQLEAEDATIVNGLVAVQGTPQNWNLPAASGTRDVGSLNKPDSSVTFTTTVPETGRYNLGILYGNQTSIGGTGVVSQQVLRIDGAEPRFVDYPATLDWVYRARKDVEVQLSAGTHTITLATSDPALGRARGEATLDRLDVTALPAWTALPAEGQAQRYEAERASNSAGVQYGYTPKRQSGAGYVTLKKGDDVTFDVAVPSDGFYDLDFTYSRAGRDGDVAATLSYDGAPLEGAALSASAGDPWQHEAKRLYLTAGVHRIGVHPVGQKPLRLDVLTVTPATDGARPVQSIEAEAGSNVLAGAARHEVSFSASGGQQVTFVGNGAANTLTIPDVEVVDGGQYMLVVHYANNERGVGGAFGHNIITRPAYISVNDGPATKVNFRNTWSWENFWSLGVPVRLEPGSNSITLSNPTSFAPNFDRFELAPLVVD